MRHGVTDFSEVFIRLSARHLPINQPDIDGMALVTLLRRVCWRPAALSSRAAARVSTPAAASIGAQRCSSYFLGIETSCDDTAAAVLDGDGTVLSSVVSSQWELNAQWRGASFATCVCSVGASSGGGADGVVRMLGGTGIVPALAARAHAENLPHVVAAALEQR